MGALEQWHFNHAGAQVRGVVVVSAQVRGVVVISAQVRGVVVDQSVALTHQAPSLDRTTCTIA